MKCIVLLTFVALCSAYPYRTGYGSGYGSGIGSIYDTGKQLKINPDGSMTMTTPTGRWITVTRGIGQNNVITVTDPTVIGTKGYQNSYEYQRGQPSEVWAQILSQYRGDINQKTGMYNTLQGLGQIENQMEQDQVIQQLKEDQIQQLIQREALKRRLQQQIQYPIGQTQQGQITERMMFQEPRTVNMFGNMPENQGMWGQQRVGMTVGDIGKTSLINRLLGNTQFQTTVPYNMYNRLGQQGGLLRRPTTSQLAQLIEEEKEILNQQDQIQEEQMMQQQQYQQLTQQQFQQQQRQQQQQMQQQYMQQLQQQVQKEQEQVLDQQQELQNEQQFTLRKLMNVGTPITKMVQQDDLWQQQPKTYRQGQYGVYGQGIQRVPMVV